MQRFSRVVFVIMLLIVFENADSQNFIVRSDVISSINSSVVQKNVWSVLNNQAGLGHVNKTIAGLSYENRFLMKVKKYLFYT